MVFKLLENEQKKPLLSKESIHRLPAQMIKGGLAAIPGIAGDFLSWPYAGINKLVSSLGGENVPYEKSALGKILPTTEKHVENLEEIPYLKPKNKLEKFTSDVGQNTMNLFMPGSLLRRGGLRGSSLLGSFATSLGANTGGEVVTDWTGDPKKGAYTKMGILFLGSLFDKPSINNEIQNLYQRSDQLLPQNATVNARGLEGNLNGLRNRILAGRQIEDLAPSERFVVDQADSFLRQINNGTASVPTLRAGLRSLNENLQRAVYEAPNRATRVRARSLAGQINRHVNHTLRDYGRQNPEWYDTFSRANDAFGTMQQSNFVTRYIENNITGNPITHGLLHALGIGVDIATGVVPYQASKIIYRIAQSPELRRMYLRIFSSATAENAPRMNAEIKKLDQKMQKEDKTKKTRFRILE
jgi:hypothetical protein